MRLPSIFQSIVPALPRFTLKKSFTLTLILLWCFSLFWLWTWGQDFVFFETKPFESSTVRWLITALYIIVALSTLLWLIIKRLQRVQGKQVQVKEEYKDPINIEINNQQRYLSHWLLRLQRHVGSSRYLYRYPWYIMIGRQQAGKTTLLKENCKLTELYTAPVNEAINATIWLNEHAVIIEPNGKLIQQNDDNPIPLLYHRLWDNLLKWLVNTRNRQPLNGIVLAVDLEQLCTFTKEERDQYYYTIQNRLLEISKTTQSRLPIYAVFTKFDLLHGFEAAFQTLDKEQRDDILGATFNITNPNAWQEELNTFWTQWVEQLNNAMPNMMMQNVDASQRPELFTFIRQVHGIKDNIISLLNKTLITSDAQPLMLRGIYFTSSLQKGQMEDLFISTISNQYKLPPQVYPTWKNTLSKHYFSYNLLNNHIFNEPNLASENKDYVKRTQKYMTRFASVGALSVLALTLGWHYYYSVNHNSGEKVLVKVKDFRQISLSKNEDRFGNLQLPILNPIRDATLAYGNYRDRSPIFADLGLYQGYKIGPYVEDTYLKLLQLRFLPAVMNGLLSDLNAAPKESEEKLAILRVMRMIEDESGRNKDIIFQYMNDRWSQVFKGQKDIQDRLTQHLNYALDHIQWKANRTKGDKLAMDTFVLFAQPIKEAQVELRTLSIYQRIYQNLRVRARGDLPADINLRAEIGASFDYLFAADNENLLYVPQLLTRDGLNHYFAKQSDKLIELTSIDSWVLDITANVQYSKTDRQEIERQITEQYISDYSATWNSSYNNLHIRSFEDIPFAIKAIEQITGGEQPFKRAIQLLKNNTSVANDEIKTPDNDTVQNIIGQQNIQIINRIHRDFAKETSVLDESNDQTSALQNAMQKLTDIHRYLLAIQNSPTPGTAALKAVQLRLNENNSDPIFELQQLARTIPDPLGRWLSEIANEVWNVVMIEAIRSLEVEWREKVVKPYKVYIDGRYPFDPKSKKDVPLSEFERFFAPDGIMDKFYQQNLKPFVDNNFSSSKLEINSLIRKDVLNQLQLADRIRKTYFKQQNLLGIQFAIQPLQMSGNKQRGILNVDGQLIEYKHAASNTVNLIWPNSMRETVESKLILVGNNDRTSRSLTFEGPWALLRLINAGKLTDVKNTTFNVRYNVDGGYIIYRIYVDEADNPFKGGLFSQFKLPETLY